MLRYLTAATIFAGAIATAHATPIVTGTHNAVTLANSIGGAGITISNVTFTTSGASTLPFAAGTFTGGTGNVGFESGIVLTTGTIACVPGPNNDSGCGLDRGGSEDTTTLEFDFSSTTGQVFFRYVFGSEEYTDFVGSTFNDAFRLLLNGVNIATIPSTTTEVAINNVNCTTNSGFYRNNNVGEANGCASLNIDVQYDGLTTVLTASGNVTANTTNRFVFTIFDRGDSVLDSGVFIQAGSFTGVDPTPVPAPSTLLLGGLALALLGVVRRRRT